MAVYEVLENLDGIDEADRSSFEEIDGKFRREVEIPDVSKMKSALQKERDAAKALNDQLARFKDVDPERYAELLKEKEETAQASMTEKERHENALRKKNEEIELAKKSAVEQVTALQAQLNTFHLDEKTTKAALAAGVLPEDVEDVLLLTSRYRKLGEKGEIVILDDDGDPTGKSLKEFFEKDFKQKKPKYYAGLPGGSGTPPGGGGRNSADLMKLSPEERLNAARARK
jgi:hypothetical protein